MGHRCMMPLKKKVFLLMGLPAPGCHDWSTKFVSAMLSGRAEPRLRLSTNSPISVQAFLTRCTAVFANNGCGPLPWRSLNSSCAHQLPIRAIVAA